MLILTTVLASATIAQQQAFIAPTQAATTQAPALATRKKTLWGNRAVALAGKPNSSLFAASLEDGNVKIIDAAGKVARPTLKGHVQPAYGLAWSPDGKYILSGDEQAKIFLWNAATGEKIREFPRLKGHQRGISSITWSPDGKMFASVGKDDSVCVWKIGGGNPVWKVVGEPTNYYGVEFRKDGALMTGTQKEGVRIHAPKSYALAAKLFLPGGQGATNFTMNSAGTLGVTAGRDSFVTLWDLKGRKRITALKGHGDMVANVALAPNNKIVASSASDANVILWDTKSYKRLQTIPNQSYIGSPLAFTGDGNYLITCSDAEIVQIHVLKPKQK